MRLVTASTTASLRTAARPSEVVYRRAALVGHGERLTLDTDLRVQTADGKHCAGTTLARPDLPAPDLGPVLRRWFTRGEEHALAA